MAVRREHISLT